MDRFSGTLGVTAEGAFAVAQVHRYGGDVEAHVVFIASGESEPLFETPSQTVVDHLAGAVRFSVAGPTMTRTHASGRAGAPWSVTRWECDGFDVVVPSDDPWVTFAKRWADDEYTQWRWRSGGFVEDEIAPPTPASPRTSGADAQRRARLAAKLKTRTRGRRRQRGRCLRRPVVRPRLGRLSGARISGGGAHPACASGNAVNLSG